MFWKRPHNISEGKFVAVATATKVFAPETFWLSLITLDSAFPRKAREVSEGIFPGHLTASGETLVR
jgi:hypothetical protein